MNTTRDAAGRKTKRQKDEHRMAAAATAAVNEKLAALYGLGLSVYVYRFISFLAHFLFHCADFLLLSETKSLAIGFDLVMVSNYTIINEK